MPTYHLNITNNNLSIHKKKVTRPDTVTISVDISKRTFDAINNTKDNTKPDVTLFDYHTIKMKCEESDHNINLDDYINITDYISYGYDSQKQKELKLKINEKILPDTLLEFFLSDKIIPKKFNVKLFKHLMIKKDAALYASSIQDLNVYFDSVMDWYKQNKNYLDITDLKAIEARLSHVYSYIPVFNIPNGSVLKIVRRVSNNLIQTKMTVIEHEYVKDKYGTYPIYELLDKKNKFSMFIFKQTTTLTDKSAWNTWTTDLWSRKHDIGDSLFYPKKIIELFNGKNHKYSLHGHSLGGALVMKTLELELPCCVARFIHNPPLPKREIKSISTKSLTLTCSKKDLISNIGSVNNIKDPKLLVIQTKMGPGVARMVHNQPSISSHITHINGNPHFPKTKKWFSSAGHAFITFIFWIVLLPLRFLYHWIRSIFSKLNQANNNN
ncbi:hypothetical protein N9N03_00830 [Chlamydiia bacterium]|jgi:hypothetical protein|nr:hypothetical protein [Chlamydiia bacterium]